MFSAFTVKRFIPNAHITLFTDKKIDCPLFDDIQIFQMSLRCKQFLLDKTPYDKTIFLDSDTKVNHNITELFDILDKYDIAMAHDFSRKRIFDIPEYGYS